MSPDNPPSNGNLPSNDNLPSDDNPMTKAQAASRAQLPKRFYKQAAAGETEGGWAVLLDDRPVRTPGRRPLTLPEQALAEAIAAEWAAQETLIDPAGMPLTRIANSALDGVSDALEQVRADAARFAETDLLCYRAEEPQGLVARQTESWDPLLDWAREALGLRFNLAGGIVHVAQPPETLERVNKIVAGFDAFALSGVHVITSLTGSMVLSLAVAHGRVSAEEAWAASLVDEDWQISQWGEDAEAKRRREERWRDMEAAARFAVIGRN